MKIWGIGQLNRELALMRILEEVLIFCWLLFLRLGTYMEYSSYTRLLYMTADHLWKINMSTSVILFIKDFKHLLRELTLSGIVV